MLYARASLNYEMFGLFHKASGSPSRKSVCRCKRFRFSNTLTVFSAAHCPARARKEPAR